MTKKQVHLLLDEDVYIDIWKIVKSRYINPVKKLHVVINQALREYIEKHKNEIKG